MWAGWGGGGYDTVKRPRLMVPTNLEIVTVGLDILATRKVEGCRVGESIWTVEQRLSRYRLNIGILRLPLRHTARDQALTLAPGLLFLDGPLIISLPSPISAAKILAFS